MPNRLSKETSPYLRQHEENPVDWYPWSEEALDRARSEDKPILLSIGYSACHWCHVMAHESFENDEIARLMNESFINIKVDREERPDLDRIYQNVAQLMTQAGGWPLTVFLTPDLKPFFGGTYFPPEDRYGRPGFPRLLKALSQAYRSDRETVDLNAKTLTEAIARIETVPVNGIESSGEWPKIDELRDVARSMLGALDMEHGGFNGGPKFPNTMPLTFLWRIGETLAWDEARDGALVSLRAMARGGIYDQLRGGFHRYSVDGHWSVPHFEKMLYDNALLLKLYAETLLADDLVYRSSLASEEAVYESAPDRSTEVRALLSPEDRRLFADVLADTVDWVLGEMTGREGAFFSAQDADSEGEEGRFFVWNPAQLRERLPEREAEAFALRFGVSDEGNFEHGMTVLSMGRTVDEVAAMMGVSAEEASELLERARHKLLAARSERVAPGTDTKILTAWNGLMVSGLIWAARALESEADDERITGPGETAGPGELGGDERGRRYRDAALRAANAARRAFRFVATECSFDEGRRLYGTFKDGEARFNGYLDDYAFMANAALDLCRFTSPDPLEKGEGSASVKDCEERFAEVCSPDRLLRRAEAWIGTILDRFSDPSGEPGYFFTSDDHEKLIQRPKSLYDQAIPSGISSALHAMLALAELDPEGAGMRFGREAGKQLSRIHPLLARSPLGFGELACVSLMAVRGAVALSGPGAEDFVLHPHFFRKPETAGVGGGLLVCHRQACRQIGTDGAVATLRSLAVGS